MKSPALPSIHAYVDYRAFLREWVEAARRADPDFSYAAFAARGGCSKAALANVLGGVRSPRPATLDAFARAMRLGPAERHHLGLLVELAGAASEERRRDLLDRILADERHGKVREAEREPEQDVERYFENWWTPAIREMATFEGFQADPAWIAMRLHPPVPVHDVAHALDTLLELGFLVRADDGRVAPREVRFRTAPETTVRAVARYQKEVMSGLLRALDTDRHQEQHTLTATLVLDPEQLKEAKARLNAVATQIATMSDVGSDRSGRRVYQIGLQLFPLSSRLDDPE